ncbi:hypothetical protein LTR66_010207 [Elasticomyces elasticus]|nr:hypothetical protein LTR66_010207 [Elasticomyces elasticus]
MKQVLVASLALLGFAAAQNASLPVVDLGYELHRATLYNSTGGFYNFSNIRYAAPPTGANRFAAPKPPAVNRTTIQTGSPDRICPQAGPAWLAIAAQYIPLYLQGQTQFNASSFSSAASNGSSALPEQDPRTTEDCLFLDVVVPEQIFNSADKGYGAPVLVWIYGGGYTLGGKSSSGNPAGLLERGKTSNGGNVIYVSMNYRLGAFGWLSGPTFQANGTANAGLYDQRMALEWVQQYIHLFGGDPRRVTVFGESAGGGSIMHQITAYGGNKGPVPFAQALTQSPGFAPIASPNQEEMIFNNYLSLLNVSTIEQARALPYSALQTANILQVGASIYGGFTYGPTVDGNFVPALPSLSLLHGHYDKSLRIMVGHNAQEGLLFTSPFVQNNSAFAASIVASFPTVAAYPKILAYITDVLYPPIFDGSQAMNYTDQIGRAAALTSEVIFTCNTYYLDRAYANKTHSYLFAVPPALHGNDIPYTYFNGANATAASTAVIAPQIAVALQEYIVDFAETGMPNGPGVPFFNIFGANATVQTLGISGITQMMDPAANARCAWWQKALYL